jgi:hypothetical protein
MASNKQKDKAQAKTLSKILKDAGVNVRTINEIKAPMKERLRRLKKLRKVNKTN